MADSCYLKGTVEKIQVGPTFPRSFPTLLEHKRRSREYQFENPSKSIPTDMVSNDVATEMGV